MFDVRVSAGGREVNTTAMATITAPVMAVMKTPPARRRCGSEFLKGEPRTRLRERFEEEERRERGEGGTREQLQWELKL